jgi:hypothetical protein
MNFWMSFRARERERERECVRACARVRVCGGGGVEEGRRGMVYEKFNEIDRSTVMSVINYTFRRRFACSLFLKYKYVVLLTE